MRRPCWIPTLGSAALRATLPGLALLSGALLASCGLKDPSFFAPENTTIDNFPDVTAPQFINYKPSASLTGVYNVNTFSVDFVDVAAPNGVPASGVDAASVKATFGTNQSLTLTRAGDTYSAALASVSDGAQTFRMEGRDAAGNAATGNITLTLDRTAPNINVTERPAASTNSNAASTEISWRLGITDPNLMNAVGAIYRAGADNTCGTADDVLVPKGTGPDQISENTWTYSLANASNLMVRYTSYNPAPAGGSTMTRKNCFVVTASDNAIGLTGALNPNVGKIALAYDFLWSPTPPPTGTIRGNVFRDGLPASGVTITLGGLSGGANTTTLTNSAGAYEFLNAEVGLRNLGVTAPTGTVCDPSVGIATVTANAVSTVNFGCNTPTGTIAGRVMIGTTPLAGVTLTVNGNTQMSDADGRYVFAGLMPGLYTIVLSNFPSTATCSVAALLVTVTSGAQTPANFTCQPKPAILRGTVLINGQPASGYRVVLNNGDFRATGADGRYEFNSINAGTYTMVIGQVPANVACNDAVVNVVASQETIQDFACGMPVFALSYAHLGTTSIVCVDITMHPSVGKLPYQVTAIGPGLLDSGIHTGTTLVGFALVRQDINQKGFYTVKVTVNGLILTQQVINVTDAAGTCNPFAFVRR